MSLRITRYRLCVAFSVLAIVVSGIVWVKRHSDPPSVYEISCDRVCQIAFSSNGEILTVRSFKQLMSDPDTVRVFRADDQTLLFERESGDHSSFGWNRDGTLLAIPRPKRKGIELWDPRTWKIRQTLPPAGANIFSNLDFDAAGNLFAATSDLLWGESSLTTEDQAVVWWREESGQEYSPPPTLIGAASGLRRTATGGFENQNAFNIAVSAASLMETRVVVSYHSGAPLEVLLARKDDAGKWSLATRYTVPDIGPSWIRITSDGRHLAVLGCETMLLTMYDVHEDRLEPRWSAQGEISYPADLFTDMSRQALEISGNGRHLVCNFDDRREVFRIADGKSMMTVPGRGVAALSADGELLAVAERGGDCIRVLRMPQSDSN